MPDFQRPKLQDFHPLPSNHTWVEFMNSPEWRDLGLVPAKLWITKRAARVCRAQKETRIPGCSCRVPRVKERTRRAIVQEEETMGVSPTRLRIRAKSTQKEKMHHSSLNSFWIVNFFVSLIKYTCLLDEQFSLEESTRKENRVASESSIYVVLYNFVISSLGQATRTAKSVVRCKLGVRRVRTTAESRCCMRPRSTEALPPLTQELRSAPGSACLSS
ncbi:hypothetical protein TNCT_346231 [Trichonephila clavata]|uniref:Uncharacterized protein n=1 Tax=Trichonephila clavata TaxID=2740835 RepID=A0A8X6LTD9_TRICU|nr:hypothetical protein TNCT_346231 [Trichonephila clavata]